MKQLLTVLLIAVIAISVNAQCNIEFTTNQIGDELQIVGQGVNETITTTTDVDFNGVGIITFTYSGSNGSSFSYNCNSVSYSSGSINDGFIYIENAVLPVELSYFKLQKIESGVSLSWQTASEKNNEGFEVQKSTNGKDFEIIDFVAGKGTTLETQNYSFIDTELENGLTYYRLKQLDSDGAFEYSDIKSINVNLPGQITFGNIVTNKIQFQETVVNAQVFNTNGQLMRTQTGTEINVQDLPAGVYFVRVNEQTFRVLKN